MTEEKFRWVYGKPKDKQKVWVVHKNDPVRAVFHDEGSMGYFYFIEYEWNCSAYKCGAWIPLTDEKPSTWPGPERDGELPF